MFQLNDVSEVSFKNSCLCCCRQDWKLPLFFGLLAASEWRNVVKKSEQHVGGRCVLTAPSPQGRCDRPALVNTSQGFSCKWHVAQTVQLRLVVKQ